MIENINEYARIERIKTIHSRETSESGFKGTIVFKMIGKDFALMSTSICNKNDQFNKKIGRRFAMERFYNKNIVIMPVSAIFAMTQ